MQTGLNKISKERYAILLSIHAELVLENAIEQRLRRLIDQALDSWDEELFQKYTAELADRKRTSYERN